MYHNPMFIAERGVQAISCISSLAFLNIGEEWGPLFDKILTAINERQAEVKVCHAAYDECLPDDVHARRVWYFLTKKLDELKGLYGQASESISVCKNALHHGRELPNREYLADVAGKLFTLELTVKYLGESLACFDLPEELAKTGSIH